MLNFPIPYQDELLYSTIARAGVRHGITSPKQMLEEIYDNRMVVATLDLPNQLEQVARWLPSSFNVGKIAYHHTLFPLYAPFIPEERRQRCLQWMTGESQGAIHLAMGVAASIVKTPAHIRYCPACLKDQKRRFGEYFWQREWQIAGVECCEKHGELVNTRFSRPPLERHRYHAASPDSCPLLPQNPVGPESLYVLRQVKKLLCQGSMTSPSFDQWSRHYHSIAQQQGFIRGRAQVDHSSIYEAILVKWSPSFLQRYGLMLDEGHDAENFWLKSIFRKHRKSFSYLQHLIVHEALLPESWSIVRVIGSVRQMSVGAFLVQPMELDSDKQCTLTQDQLEWMQLLEAHNPKAARNCDPALYARLYRYDRSWLKNTNVRQQREKKTEKKRRVDWQQRDQSYLSKLREVIRFLKANGSGPRRSRNLLLKRLGKSSTLEKKLHLLPQTRFLLEQYSETVAQYQIRRLLNAYAELKLDYECPPLWRLLRRATLSEARLSDEAREYLDRLEEYQDENQGNREQKSR